MKKNLFRLITISGIFLFALTLFSSTVHADIDAPATWAYRTTRVYSNPPATIYVEVANPVVKRLYRGIIGLENRYAPGNVRIYSGTLFRSDLPYMSRSILAVENEKVDLNLNKLIPND